MVRDTGRPRSLARHVYYALPDSIYGCDRYHWNKVGAGIRVSDIQFEIPAEAIRA